MNGLTQWQTSPAQSPIGKLSSSLQSAGAKQAPRPLPPAYELLGSELGCSLRQRWPSPCEAMFEHLAGANPNALAKLVSSDALHHTDLTFAAEALGQIQDAQFARSLLMQLLDHPKPVVREGALQGLRHVLDAESMQRIKGVSKDDPNATIRRIALEICNDE